MVSTGPNTLWTSTWGGFARILPFIEGGAIANAINLNAPYGDPGNMTGTSQTIAFSELLVSTPSADNTKRANGVTGAPDSDTYRRLDGSLQVNIAGTLAGLQACTTAFQGGSNISNLTGRKWMWGNMSFNLFNTIVPPNSKVYRWGSCRYGCGGCNPDDSSFANASSNHSGNVQVLMSDGSVRSIKDSITMQIWMVLGTVANGETVSSDSY